MFQRLMLLMPLFEVMVFEVMVFELSVRMMFVWMLQVMVWLELPRH